MAQGIIPQEDEEEVSSGEDPIDEGEIRRAMNRMQKLDRSIQKENQRNMKRKKRRDKSSEDEGNVLIDFLFCVVMVHLY